MTTRAERIGGRLEIRVPLTEQMIEALSIHEDDVLEAEAIDGRLELTPASRVPRHIAAYRRSLSEHKGVYAELAK